SSTFVPYTTLFRSVLSERWLLIERSIIFLSNDEGIKSGKKCTYPGQGCIIARPDVGHLVTIYGCIRNGNAGLPPHSIAARCPPAGAQDGQANRLCTQLGRASCRARVWVS